MYLICLEEGGSLHYGIRDVIWGECNDCNLIGGPFECSFLTKGSMCHRTQFFTQEYEGRDTDISLIPWQNHRSLTSAMLNLIHNPTSQEFMDWVKAAERETWR
jgi:hypothetical protein